MTAGELAPAKGFAPNDPWDRNFFLAMTGLVWLGILRGFGGDMIQHVQSHAPAYHLIVHVHAVVYVLWLVLFTVQVFLIRSRKVQIHQQLGFALVYLAILMALIGPATALTVQHHAIGNPKADPGFLSIQFTDILAFASLTGAAIVLRKSSAAHKRLILLGTLYITDAGYARWLADSWLQFLGGMSFWHGWLAFYLAPNVLVLLVGVYDFVTRRKFHPAYVIGAAWIFAIQMLSLSLYFSPAWTEFAKRVIAAWP